MNREFAPVGCIFSVTIPVLPIVFQQSRSDLLSATVERAGFTGQQYPREDRIIKGDYACTHLSINRQRIDFGPGRFGKRNAVAGNKHIPEQTGGQPLHTSIVRNNSPYVPEVNWLLVKRS